MSLWKRIIPLALQQNRTHYRYWLTKCAVPFSTSMSHKGFEDPEMATLRKYNMPKKEHKLLKSYKYPPQEPGDPPRPAEICHMMFDIKYSQKKLWYFALVIKGKSIDEALKYLSFNTRKGAAIAKQVLEEAQLMAVNEYNVEYKSNLWVENALALKGTTLPRDFILKKKSRQTPIQISLSNFFVILREGKPPKEYYQSEATGHQKLEDYIKSQRLRTIQLSL